MSNRRVVQGTVHSITVDGKELKGVVEAHPPELKPGVLLIDDPMMCIHCQHMRKRIRELERLNKTLHKKVRKLKGGKRR